MKKKLVKEEIFSKHYEGIITGIKVSDLPIDLLPTDIIDIVKDEGYFSENNSWNAFSMLTVSREREETDIEFNKRKIETEERLLEAKERRREQYVKLKKEFES
mgnify:FL=1